MALAALNRLRAHAIAEAAGMKHSHFIRTLDAAKPIFLQIEAASPSVGAAGSALTREESERTANVEYPWQAADDDPNSWVVPASHSFPVIRQLRYDPRSATAVRLLDRVISAANTILP